MISLMSLRYSHQRNKSSLLPVVGQLMSSLFGIVSEDDPEDEQEY